jgi:hypothetical protein
MRPYPKHVKKRLAQEDIADREARLAKAEYTGGMYSYRFFVALCGFLGSVAFCFLVSWLGIIPAVVCAYWTYKYAELAWDYEDGNERYAKVLARKKANYVRQYEPHMGR